MAGRTGLRLDTPGRRRLALATALVAWIAVAAQLWVSLRHAAGRGYGPGVGLLVYFGYFTVVTNLLAGVALGAVLAVPRSRAGRAFAHPQVVTALTAALLFVGAAYWVLLGDRDPRGLRFLTHMALHYATPGLFLLLWAWCVPKDGLRLTDVPRWTLYPLAYGLYILVRGELTGLYPYPFVDVERLGYGRVLLHTAGILAGFSAIAAGLVAMARAGAVPAGPARAPGRE